MNLFEPTASPMPDKIINLKENVQKTINIGFIESKFSDVLEEQSYSEPPMQYQDAFIEYEDFISQLITRSIPLYMVK